MHSRHGSAIILIKHAAYCGHHLVSPSALSSFLCLRPWPLFSLQCLLLLLLLRRWLLLRLLLGYEVVLDLLVVALDLAVVALDLPFDLPYGSSWSSCGGSWSTFFLRSAVSRAFWFSMWWLLIYLWWLLIYHVVALDLPCGGSWSTERWLFVGILCVWMSSSGSYSASLS